MIHYVDNFLPEEQFQALKERVAARFVATDITKFEVNSDEPVRITYHDKEGNWREGCNLLGLECIPAVELILKEFDKIGVTELQNWSMWYQYIINTMTIPVHQDQNLRYSSKRHTYTAVIYTSEWEPGYGGEFVVGEPVYDNFSGNSLVRADGIIPTQIVEPLPNRMLIWSRDTWHAVNKVTVDDPSYKRSFFGSGWSSISDEKHSRNTIR
jgi:hypothetical protein